MSETTQGPGPAPEELQALQAAEEAKADPTLDEVEPAAIDVPEEPEKEEPFEKLAAQARRLSAGARPRRRGGAALPRREAAPGRGVRQATGLEPAADPQGARRALRATTAKASRASCCTRSPAAGSSAPPRTPPTSRAASSG